MFADSESFPRELLEQTFERRTGFFKDHKVAHSHLMRAYELLKEIIRQPAGITIVKVIGLTGAGKTTLRMMIETHLIQETLHDLAVDSSRLPFVSLQVPGYERGFDWSDLYRRLLRVMDEPLIDRRVKLVRHPGAESRPAFPVAETKSMAALRESFESALRHRRPVVVMMDDAQRFARVTGSRKLSDQQDVIQSLADEANVLFILLGTYQLTQFIGLSGQLARRATTVHLPRYRITEPAEANAFLSVLDNFQRHLPMERQPDLLAQRDLLYRRSLGCVGILKDWLTKALSLAGQSRSQSITLEQLKATAPDVASCHTILTEATEGELLLDLNSDERALERRLWTPSSKNAVKKENAGENTKRSRRQPFDRNPGRDRVGLDLNVS